MLIREFRPPDFFQVDGREGKPDPVTDWWMADMYFKRGFFVHDGELCNSAFTCTIGGRVVACAGMMIFSRLGQLWMHVSTEAVERPLRFHRAVRDMLSLVKEHSGVLRIETSIDKNRHNNCKWIQSLGLEFESDMPKYGPGGETFARFAWLKKD